MPALFSRLMAVAIACACLSIVAPASPAYAQQSDEARKAKSKQLYAQATAQYNLGNFDKAVELYTQAYLAWPAPVLLFNIAQAHRLNGNCKQAIFSYRRYLAEEARVSNRKQILRLIERLEVDCKREQETREKPPVKTLPPDGDLGGAEKNDTPAKTNPETDTKTTTTTPTGEPEKKDGPKENPQVAENSFGHPEEHRNDVDLVVDDPAAGLGEQPGAAKLGLIAQVGPAFASFGALNGTALFSGRIGGAYLLPAGPVNLELGGTVTFTPVPFEARDGKAKTGMLIGVLANAGGTYPIWNKLSARGELGLGLMVLQGLTEAGSIFVMDQFGSTGAVSVVHLRAAVGLDWALSDNISINATPLVVAYSPALENMAETVSSLTRFELLLGVAYRL